MDMEQRKINWANRVNDAVNFKMTVVEIRRLVSICQDAFNEGHKAATQERIDQDYANNRFA